MLRLKRFSLVPAVLALCWVWRGLLRGEVFFERDQLLVFLPLKRSLSERLNAGDFPAWWPWDGLGQPLAAIPIASAFHPTTLAYLALPFEWAYSAQTLIAFPIALWGAWRLGRTLGLKRWGSAFAATAFTCGFYFVALAEQTQMHLAAMSVPWVWCLAIRVSRSRRGSRTGLSLAVANLMLGGDPMLFELTAITTAVLVLAGGRRRVAGVVRVFLSSLVGLLLSAVQWVPMLGVLAESPRAAGLGIDVNDFWATRPEHLLGVVWPGAFAPETFLFETTYVGLPTLLLAGLAVSRRWRWRWPLLGIVVGSVVLSAGRALGLWQVFAAVIPGWQGFQFPAKALSAAALALALLAGRGLVLLSQKRSRALAGPVLVGLVAFELVLNGADVVTKPWSQLGPSPLVEALRSVGVGLGKQSYLQAYRVKKYDERVQADTWNWETAKPSTGAWHGLPSSIPYLQGFTRRYFDVAIEDRSAWLSKRAALFGNAAFVLRTMDLTEAQRPRVVAVLEDSEAAVLRASQAFPFAYLAWNVRRVPEADEVAALSGRAVVVPADGEYAVPETFNRQSERPMEPVNVTRHTGDTLELTVNLPEPGLLIINEAFTASTRAFEGDTELAVFPANHAVLGLALTAGAHTVRVEREVGGLETGALVSAIAALGLLALGRRSTARVSQK